MARSPSPKSFCRRKLEGIEIAYLDCTGHIFPKHAHDEFVIGANWMGREAIWIDGKSLEAATDQITLYNPAQMQAADGNAAPWAFVSLYIEPRMLGAIFGLSPETVFEIPVLSHPHLARSLRHAAAYSLSREVSDDQATEAITTVLAELLALAGSDAPLLRGHVPPRIRRIAERLLAMPHELPSLKDLAGGEDMTPVQLVRAFSRTYGLPPFAWLMVERLKQARLKLAGGDRLAMISADLGFADQAHFTRRFKAMYGVAPGVWRDG